MSKLFVFRQYKKKQGKKNTRHPKLIVDEDKKDFGFMGLTSRKKKGKGHNNYPLLKNPQIINDVRKEGKSYLRKKVEYDVKSNFGKIDNNYQLHPDDLVRLIPYVDKHKKKR